MTSPESADDICGDLSWPSRPLTEAPFPDRDAGPEPGAPRARVIAFANQKGGVGKSTSTTGVAGWLARGGERVLVVDLDPQANATTGLGIDPRRVGSAGNIYQILLGETALPDAIEPTMLRNLFCVPSGIDLAASEIELVPVFSREYRLRTALESVLEEFTFILIDCPPSLGLLTVNALAAADEVLVPVQCEYYALEGLRQLLHNIEKVRRGLNPELKVRGFLLTMFDPRTKLAHEVADDVRRHFPAQVFDTVVPRSVRLSEAPSHGQPIAVYDPESKGGEAYRLVTEELKSGGGPQAHEGGGHEEAAGPQTSPEPQLARGAERADWGAA